MRVWGANTPRKVISKDPGNPANLVCSENRQMCPRSREGEEKAAGAEVGEVGRDSVL